MPIRERTPPQPRTEQAEVLALQMVQFLLDDEGMAQTFLDVTGTSPDDLRRRVNEPDFLGGVIDYLLGREDLLLAFCEAQRIEPTLPARLRGALP